MYPSPVHKEAAFTQLFYNTKDQVYSFLLQYTSDQHLIEDMMQVCYVRVWEKMENWQDTDKLLPLIKTIAKNLLLNEIRQKARLPLEWLPEAERIEAIALETDIRHTRQTLQRIDKAIDALPDQCRKVYLLHREEKLSYQEIAEKLSISTQTVKNHMSRAIQLLKNELQVAYPLALLLLVTAMD
jgi:RNA polymerase sigma-70 factor (ECF subfamily)